MESLCYTKNGCTLSVEISESGNINYDAAFLCPAVETEQHLQRVCILAAFEPQNRRIFMEDLRGNGHGSGLQGQGIGTLLFNTVLQLFQSKYPTDTLVYGELSTNRDPKEPSLARICAERREGYWSSFGFRVEEDPRQERFILATLGELALKRHGKDIQGLFPRFVDLSELSHGQP